MVLILGFTDPKILIPKDFNPGLFIFFFFLRFSKGLIKYQKKINDTNNINDTNDTSFNYIHKPG
jgi:hypothetical protein